MRIPMIAVGLATAWPAMAEDLGPQMLDFLETEIRGWAQDAILIEAVRAQNSVTSAYSQEDIDALDAAWRAEVGLADRPTIEPVLGNAASDFLRDVIAEAGGTMTEVFVMDARGLNVATSDVTSDFWQGDEEKYSETFLKGAGAVHLGEVEFDESTQTYQGQISLSLVDPVSNELIGAMTVGVDAQAFD